MRQTVIENPILNSPFTEPKRHFKFDEDGITNEIIASRRSSASFIPIAKPKKRGTQLEFDTEWTEDRIRENELVNQIRSRVSKWRADGYIGITRTTRYLLDYWNDPQREKKLFFCQREAAETAIFLAECAEIYNEGWILETLRQKNLDGNSQLFRIALKMATGSGKTVVMAMLICWQVLNKAADTRDARFSDAFLIVTPGITIRDRLRVLLPNDPTNFYLQRDLIPTTRMEELGRAKIVITNFHAFLAREKGDASRLAKEILGRGAKSPLAETPGQVVRRVCRELGGKKNVVVINDEAHHCYRGPAEGENVALSAEERREAEKRDEQARVWISGLEAVKEKIGIRTVYDLSATPFFLRGSGYPEGTLFPWVVSDFSLIDAIESGIVKIPRVPVSDNQMAAALPVYRDLWPHIKDELPKKGRKTEAIGGEPHLPKHLEAALHSLYSDYEKQYLVWDDKERPGKESGIPPVFIVVCNNTNVSKMLYDYIAGWEKTDKEGDARLAPGSLKLFSNVEGDDWKPRPNTILIDSEQLESGEAMSPEFKKIVALEIAEFKHEYKIRFPGRDAERLTDEDIMREVLNTVGKPGKLGEQVKCVVSVSMLSEGWDANTVTHILGVRAFGTQLLCEQVVGRGLRRISYTANADDKFEPEYAEVYGVPFSFIPCSGPHPGPVQSRKVTHVRALPERIGCEIVFPRIQGYRYELPNDVLSARFSQDSIQTLSTLQIPTKVVVEPIIGETNIHTLEDLKRIREQEVAFRLARLVLEKYFRNRDEEPKRWLFPQLLSITKRWMDECVKLKDNTFPQLLILLDSAHTAADKIFQSIMQSSKGAKTLLPIPYAYDPMGSTRYVEFDTTKSVYVTDKRFCHVSHVVADTGNWEQKLAQSLEELGESGTVVSYVKNQNLGFTIPYTFEGKERNYFPDFIVKVNDGNADALNLVLEVTGQKKPDKEVKASTARALWIPAVNNHGGYGRWTYIENFDPWNAENHIRGAIENVKKGV
jgi:type III restriction enzyme